jgi:hypothetical protein
MIARRLASWSEASSDPLMAGRYFDPQLHIQRGPESAREERQHLDTFLTLSQRYTARFHYVQSVGEGSCVRDIAFASSLNCKIQQQPHCTSRTL